MILFLLNYEQDRKNLSIDEYFTIGDLQEACLIKYSLRDEDIDYIYFLSENKLIILGTDELRYSDTVSDMINKYNIFEYKIFIKKYYEITNMSEITYDYTLNNTVRRMMYYRFQSYLQERNDRLIAERLLNQEIQENEIESESESESEIQEIDINNENQTQNTRNYSPSEYEDDISDFTSDYSDNEQKNIENNEDNSSDNIQNITVNNQNSYTGQSINDISDESSSDSDYNNENEDNNTEEKKKDSEIEYNNNNSIRNIDSTPLQLTNPYSENEVVIQRGIIPTRSVNRPINSLNSRNSFISNYTSRNRRFIPIQRFRRRHMDIRRSRFRERLNEIEAQYGLSLNTFNEESLRNESANTVSSLMNLMNRTIGLISIHDLLNEYSSGLNTTLSNISNNSNRSSVNIQTPPTTMTMSNLPNTENNNDIHRNIRNMINQINIDDENQNNHVLIDTPEDVKILMSQEEFSEMECKTYIEYIQRVRPESINTITENNEIEIVIDDNDICTICTDDFKITDDIIILPKCNHIFHKQCIGRWLTEFKNKCPLCNTDVSDNPIHV